MKRELRSRSLRVVCDVVVYNLEQNAVICEQVSRNSSNDIYNHG